MEHLPTMTRREADNRAHANNILNAAKVAASLIATYGGVFNFTALSDATRDYSSLVERTINSIIPVVPTSEGGQYMLQTFIDNPAYAVLGAGALSIIGFSAEFVIDATSYRDNPHKFVYEEYDHKLIEP